MPAAATALKPAPAASARPSLLVLTASRTVAALIAAVLRGGGFEVASAARAQALAAGAATLAADVIVLEVSEGSQIDRAGSLFPNCALVALVPDNRPDLRARAEAAAFRGCLASPVDPPALLDVIGGLLGSSARAQGCAVKPRAAIDERALEDLAGLGGADFVRDIISQFLDDASSILKALEGAMRAGDASAFRDHAHALRSCAANVGASSVYARCLELRGIEARELAELGETHVRELDADVARAREALAAYIGRGLQT